MATPKMCEVIGCTAPVRVTFQGKDYCSIHAIEAEANYAPELRKEAEQARIRGPHIDKK